MQRWNTVIPDNPPIRRRTKQLNSKIDQFYEEITLKYPKMQFKRKKNDEIRIYFDNELADTMRTWKSPYNELWNYGNQLQIREKRLNKKILALKSL